MARGFRGCVAVATLVAVSTLTQPALADTLLGENDGAFYVSDGLTVPIGPDDALIDLECATAGPDTKATGGGFTSTPGFADATALWSFPFPTSWRTYQYLSAGGMQFATGFLICKKGKLRYPERSVKVKGGKAGTAKVPCRDGMHIAGGGGLIQSVPGEARLNSSYPFDDGDAGKRPDDGWVVRAINEGDDADFLEAHAVCQKREPRYVSNAPNDLVAGGTGGSIPFCRPAEHLIGLGAKLAGAAGTSELHILKPQDSKADGGTLPDDGVLANASNLAGENKRLNAYAICEQ
jgi:hypothetical protein